MKKDNQQDTAAGDRPAIDLRDGSLRAASWRSDGEYGPMFNTKITRTYSDDDGEFRETPYLREQDLLPAAELAHETHSQIKDRKREYMQSRATGQNVPVAGNVRAENFRPRPVENLLASTQK